MAETKRGTVYNRTFNKEDWAKVNPENKEMIEDYLEEYRQRQKKESTLKQYFNDLRIISIYVLKKLKNRSFIELNKKDFRKMSLYLTSELSLSNARVNRLMSCMRSLLTYIEDDDDYDYDSNIASKVKGLKKQPVRLNEDNFFLSHEQIMKLRAKLIELDRLQDAVLLMLAYDSGGRKNEIFQVQKHGLLEGNRTNLVQGKGNKKFTLVYLNDTKELIRQYLEQRGDDDVDSLWYKGTGENKSPVEIGRIYDRVLSMSRLLSEIEGKEIQFFVHSLRHSRAENLNQGLDPRIKDKDGKPRKLQLEEIQKLLHHTSIAVTEIYVKNHDEDVVDEIFGIGE